MNLYTRVYERHDEFTGIEVAKEVIAYEMVEDTAASALLLQLPPGFTEHNFLIRERETPRAHVAFAFEASKLVNFNVQVFPKEWFKLRAIKQAIHQRLLPYVVDKTNAEWCDAGPLGVLNDDQARGLVHNVRINTQHPVAVSASIVDRRFA